MWWEGESYQLSPRHSQYSLLQSLAKLQVQLDAEFSFNFSFPHPHPPTRASSEIAGNEQNLLSNIGRTTLEESKSFLKIWGKGTTNYMEDDLSGRHLSGRRPSWKTSSVEDELSRKQHQWKTNSVEDDLSRRQPQWRTPQ